jgi:hypothetical protein
LAGRYPAYKFMIMEKCKNIIGLLFFLCCISAQVFSQTAACGTDLLRNELMKDSAYSREARRYENKISLAISNENRDANVIYTIPVVVHVIHTGEALGTGTNISNAQIIAAIADLNARWRNVNGQGVDIEIQFCLATRDPNGNATTGINRVNGNVIPNYNANGVNFIYSDCGGAIETSVKDLSKWPTTKYYNIWIVNSLCHGLVSGVAYHPAALNPYDGLTISATSISDFNSAVFSHEMGHAFHLYHTFEGDGGGANCPALLPCATTGDLVCDTPAHKSTDCTANSCTTEGIWANSQKNYMSYCNHFFGSDRFTLGQKNRMRATAAAAPRSSLLTSNACATLGIDEADKELFDIFPNPAKNAFTIQLTNAVEKGKIIVFSIIGAEVLERNINSETTVIDISRLPKGVYIVNYSNGNAQINKKLIID